MDIEQDVRTLLRDRAGSVVARTDLLDAVRARRAQLRNRRRAIALALVLAAIMLAALPVAALWQRQPTAPVGVELATPVALPDFPLTPTWEPDWVGLRSFRYIRTAGGSEMTLRYEPTYPQATTLTVTVTPTGRGITGETVDIDGHPGVVNRVAGTIDVEWQFPGGWARVIAAGRVSQDEILHFADALAPTPLKMDTPFATTLLPADARLLAMDTSSMVYTQAGAGDVRLTITLVPSGSVAAVGNQPVTESGSMIAYRRVDRDRMVKLEVSSAWGVTPDQVVAMAGGIDVTQIALTRGG